MAASCGACAARAPPSVAPSGFGPWQCDKISSLAEYKDQSCPTFMLYKVRHRRHSRARHHPTLPHARCLAPLVPQGGQVVETIVGPKIAAIANAVKAMCEDAPAAAAE